MLYVTVDRTVRRPPPVVWMFLTDLAVATAWVDGLVDVQTSDNAPVGAGAQLVVRRRVGPQGELQRVLSEITAFREASLLALETRLAKAVLYDRVALESVPEGTRLELCAELHDPRSFGRAQGLSEPSLLELTLRSAYERSLDALVTRIERESAIPYR